MNDTPDMHDQNDLAPFAPPSAPMAMPEQSLARPRKRVHRFTMFRLPFLAWR